jgi:hypothetical protein
MGVVMPKEFIDCVKNGGKVITKKLSKNKYMHICYDKKGNAYPGEVKERESAKDILDELNELQDILRKTKQR